MSHSILDALKKHRVLVSDGAMGTELDKAGLAPGECPEAWNETHPDAVRAIAKSYFDAGSDMVLTNTFGASRFKLAKFDLADRVADLVSAGVRLAKEAAPEGGMVAVSIGPTGEFMAPLGTVTEEEMTEAFAQEARAAADAGADGACVETMSALDETICAVRAAKAAGLCTMATMSFGKGPAGYRTMMGVSPEDAARALAAAGADVVGTNCGVPVDDAIEIVKAMRAVTDKPILVHVNAGLPQLVDGKTVFVDDPEALAAHALALAEAGADIIGGCCGATPEHIRAIAEALAPVRT